MEMIEQIAKSQNLEEDEYWLTGVAWTMMQGENVTHTRKAIEYYEKAILLSEARTRAVYGIEKPTAWVTYEGLGRCYGDNLRQPLPATKAMQKAIEALPNHCLELGVDSYFRARAALWQLQMGGNCEDACRIGREAYERCQSCAFGTNSPSDHVIMDSVKLYMEILSLAQDYVSVASVLRDIATRETLLPGYSLLNCLLRHKFTDQEFKRLTSIIAMTLYQICDTDLENLLHDSFMQIAYVDTSGKLTWSELRLAIRSANFLHRHFKDLKGAGQVYKNILTAIDSNDEAYRLRMKPMRSQASAFLSLRQFSEAVEAKLSRQSGYSQMAERLKALAQKDRRQYRASYSALLYGVWVRDHRLKSPKVWRPIFQPSIAESIRKLHDEDPWNDEDAYTQLGEALMMGNDLENAAIAFGIAMMQMDQNSTDSSTPGKEDNSDKDLKDPSHKKQHPDYTGFSKLHRCDGICDPNKDGFEELWSCCICEKTWLCGECLLLLKKQDPEADRYVICSSDHTHLRAYPLSDKAKAIVQDLQVNDLDKHDQWLRKVQEVWNIPTV